MNALIPKLASPALLALVATGVVSADEAIYRKGYVDGPYGQIHYHSARPAAGAGGKTPVVFFHQNPKSGEEYRPVLEVIGRNRPAFAFDTPGYGESDRPPEAPLMADLANAMAMALENLGFGAEGAGKVDVFGFHTGAFIASELAILRPDLVRRVVLSGIAYRPAEERARLLAELPRDATWPEDGTYPMNRWYLIVINRAEGVPLERAARLFLEDMHSLDKSWYAYNAVWNYVPEDRLPRITQPVLVLAPHEILLEESRQAREELLPEAELVELPDVIDDVFDTGPEAISAALIEWLDK
jgi:pimeloyl-ACP methyl ester carboxylesterase